MIALGTVAIGVAAVLVWGPQYETRAPERTPVSNVTPPPKDKTPVIPAGARVDTPATPPKAPPGFRERYRTSKDFAALVSSISSAASAGDHEAEYVTAEALKYCDEGLRRFFFKSNGPARSLGEAQSRWANRPAGYQQEIVDIYERCHSFLEDPELKSTLSSRTTWMDRAAAAGYPPAVAEEADATRVAAMIAEAATANGQGSSEALKRAARLAVSAAASGDPDALIKMQNWVNPKTHSGEEYGDLVSAWQLVACQRGYDCGENSEYLRALCVYDPQCASGETFTDYLQRNLGERFEVVLSLAAEIQAAVAAKDRAALRSHL